MIFELVPRVSLGPIVFGTTREELRRELASISNVSEFFKTPDSAMPTDDFVNIGIHVYYSDDLRCRGIEVFSPNHVVLSGKELLGVKFSEATKALRQLGHKASLDASGLTCRKLRLGLYSPGYEDNPDAIVETVYVTNAPYP